MAINNGLYHYFFEAFGLYNPSNITSVSTDGTPTTGIFGSTYLDTNATTIGDSVSVPADSIWTINCTLYLENSGDASQAALQVIANSGAGNETFNLALAEFLTPTSINLSGSITLLCVQGSVIAPQLVLSGGTLNNAEITGSASPYTTIFSGYMHRYN